MVSRPARVHERLERLHCASQLMYILVQDGTMHDRSRQWASGEQELLLSLFSRLSNVDNVDETARIRALSKLVHLIKYSHSLTPPGAILFGNRVVLLQLIIGELLVAS